MPIKGLLLVLFVNNFTKIPPGNGFYRMLVLWHSLRFLIGRFVLYGQVINRAG